MIDITGLREDKRPQSATIVHALLDRLEAAEKERDALRAESDTRKALMIERMAKMDQMDSLISRLQRPGYDLQKEQAIQEAVVELRRLNAERDELRTQIETMERQEPVAWRTFDGEGGYDYRSYEDNENYKLGWDARNPNHIGWVEPLYTSPMAHKENDDGMATD